jgi:hypothetical protein
MATFATVPIKQFSIVSKRMPKGKAAAPCACAAARMSNRSRQNISSLGVFETFSAVRVRDSYVPPVPRFAL